MTSNTAKVLQFPQQETNFQSSTSSRTDFIYQILQSTEIQDELSAMIEKEINKRLSELEFSHISKHQDNPFGPIFIYDLQPDNVFEMSRLEEYANIKDLSGEIDFDDGL